MKKIFLLVLVISIYANSVAQQLPTKLEIIYSLKLVNDYWISKNTVPGNNLWARSAYFTGCMGFYKIYPKESYLEYMNLWANNNSWALNGGTITRHADNHTCGQTYIDLYNLDTDKSGGKISDIKTSVDLMVNSTKIDDWWWVDALYMSMPVYARLGVLYNDAAYFDKMYALFRDTKVTRALFNQSEGLWYRDQNFDPPFYTPSGQDSYWSRGNGWAFGALVRVLELLPTTDLHRQEYIDTFKKMAQALKNRQRTDGFWNVSLDDPTDFAGPETSGTAFFTYGLAWGINNHFLDSATYYPTMVKAWTGLATIAVQPSGFLAFVQGVGSNPSSSQPVNVNTTADFGVGAFLLAGTEVCKLAAGIMPIPKNMGITLVKVLDKNHVKVSFSKKLDFSTVLVSANFTINNKANNSIAVSSVAKAEDDYSVVLTVNDLGFGYYQIQASNVKSIANDEIDATEIRQFAFSGIAAVTASDFQPNTTNTADMTIDFDFSTRWSSDRQGKWIIYDLGETKKVLSLDLAYYVGNTRKSYFTIQLSANGVDFTTALNGTTSGTTLELENYDFVDQNARYVKIIGNGNSSSTWNSITEARINYNNISSGINNFAAENSEMIIYPNPCNGKNLTIHASSFSGSAVVRISDLSGKILYSVDSKIDNNLIEINRINLKQGMYIVRIFGVSNSKSGVLIVK